jgi:hypothetical protein
MPTYSFNPHYSANKGSVLAISLVMLTAITLVSITSMQRSGLQGRMVSNIQHKEKGFHAANSELEGIYQFYGSKGSAAKALSKPISSFDMVNGKQVFQEVETGYTSTYHSYSPDHGSSFTATRLQIDSNILHKGTSIAEGFSYGSFVEHSFVVTSSSRKPDTGSNSGDLLSSQSIGVNFIAPAG